MKHPSSRELFSHWDACRRGRAAPERSEIEPGEIRHTLGDVFLLALDAEKGHTFRLAGTRICALFGHELRGERFGGLWDQADRPQIDKLMDFSQRDNPGVVIGAVGQTGQSDQATALELLILPLLYRGRLGLRAIGTLTPFKTPDWFGAARIRTLALGGFRYCEQETRASAVRAVETTLPSVLRRHGFVVYEGSRR